MRLDKLRQGASIARRVSQPEGLDCFRPYASPCEVRKSNVQPLFATEELLGEELRRHLVGEVERLTLIVSLLLLLGHLLLWHRDAVLLS